MIFDGRTPWRSAFGFAWSMLQVTALTLGLTACGVKNDLVKPNGQATPKHASDPSRPPDPLGR
jgi:hypothetical protein